MTTCCNLCQSRTDAGQPRVASKGPIHKSNTNDLLQIVFASYFLFALASQLKTAASCGFHSIDHGWAQTAEKHWL